MNKNESLFTILNIRKGTRLERRDIRQSVLVFFISGRISVVGNNLIKTLIDADRILLLPKYAAAYGEAVTDCVFVTCVLPDEISEEGKVIKSSLSGPLPDDFVYEFNTLPMVPAVRKSLNLLCEMLGYKALSYEYQRIKLREIIMCMKELYAPKDLAAFFYPLCSGDNADFRDFVINNYRSFNDVASFAGYANMSVSTFSRNFKKAFGVTAYRWLNDRRSEMIYKDIVYTDIPFGEIAEKYDFSTPSYLIYYCKRQFGDIPSNLRKLKHLAKAD